MAQFQRRKAFTLARQMKVPDERWQHIVVLH
jgi:hypothetical protein